MLSSPRCPRCRAQYDRVMEGSTPAARIALLARQYDIGINVRRRRGRPSGGSPLDLLEKLCFGPELAGWNGIGFVIQAYQALSVLSLIT
ncbi:hypothetical protein MJ585_10665 [Klebsiella pneumoniae]|nr:hypothetical protein MJ585_10665 [Klebsiella pneumoniae]